MDVNAQNGHFAAHTQRRNDVTLISLGGELDYSEVPALERALAEGVSAGDAGSVVDLSGLTFIDCAGVRSLLAAQENASRGGHLITFVHAAGIVQKVFALTGHGASVQPPVGSASQESFSVENVSEMAGVLAR